MLCHWTLQNTYYVRPHYQDTESNQLYLIHRNKHKEAAKMRRQRNMAQMKEQIKTPEKELNEMEISNLLGAEFKTVIIRYSKNLMRTSTAQKRSSQKQRTNYLE